LVGRRVGAFIATHTVSVTNAASAGRHVFVEKPVTMTEGEGPCCIAATASTGRADVLVRTSIDDGPVVAREFESEAVGMLHRHLRPLHDLPRGAGQQRWAWNAVESAVSGRPVSVVSVDR
jgi:hypothetical protein